MPLLVEKLVVGQMRTNCYLIYDRETLQGIIVDPGDDADFVESNISRLNIKPVAVILTHGHFDHVMAAQEIKLAYDIPLLLNKNDLFLMRHAAKSSAYFLNILDDKTKIKYFNFDIIETPGHTPGSVCLYFKKEDFIFAGDLIFENGVVGRSDFSYSNRELLKESIAKIISLPDRTVVYSGHGDEFTIKEFKLF